MHTRKTAPGARRSYKEGGGPEDLDGRREFPGLSGGGEDSSQRTDGDLLQHICSSQAHIEDFNLKPSILIKGWKGR